MVAIAQEVDAAPATIALPRRTGAGALAAEARVAATVVAAPAAVLGIGLEVHPPPGTAGAAVAGEAAALPTLRGPASPLPAGQPLAAPDPAGPLAKPAATALVPPAAGRGGRLRLDVGSDGPAEETGQHPERPPPGLGLSEPGRQLPGESVEALLIHLYTP